MKLNQIIVISILLLPFAEISYATPENALSKENLEALIKGNTIDGHHLRKDYSFAIYFKSDGRHVENREGNLKPGDWHVNPKGKLCWSYDSKEKTWCRWIVKNGDGSYSKVKGSGKKVRKFKVLEGNPKEL